MCAAYHNIGTRAMTRDEYGRHKNRTNICDGAFIGSYSFFFSSRRRHTRSVSAFLLNRSSDLMLRDFIGIRVNRAKKSGMVNITSSVNSRERSGINTILHELNPLFTINVTMRDIKSKNVYSRVNSKATTQWRKTESANGVHL